MTTTVGSIKFDLSIDGSNLDDEITAAIQRHMGPAMARLQQQLDEVGDKYERMGARAAAATNVATHATDAQTHSLERQIVVLDRAAAAWDRLARAQAAAAAVPTPDGPGDDRLGAGTRGGGGSSRNVTNRTHYDQRVTNRYDQRVDRRVINYIDNRVYNGGDGGGGGPDDPGGRGGGGGGNDRGRRRGVLGFLTGPVGLNLIAQGAAALPAVATAVTNIVGAVQQLGQAGLALPGIFAGGAASIGTALIGFKGIGDAVKALNDAESDPKKLEKANEQLAKMAPNAAAVAREVSKLTQGPLREFQKSIAQPMLEGVAEQLGSTADKVLPRVQPGMQKVAGAWNNTIKTALSTLSSDNSLNLADQIFGNTAEGQNRATKAIGPIVNAFGTLAKEGSYFLPRLGDAITSVSERFERFITKNSESGKMFRWIDESFNGLRAFGNSLLNIGKILTGLTRAAGQAKGSLSGDGGFLGSLERVTTKWSAFVNSDLGQAKIGKFFADGTADLHRYGDLFKDLWPALKQIIDGFQTWGQVMFPIIKAAGSLLNTLSGVPGLLEGIMVGFLAWRTIGGIIGGITTRLGGMTTALGGVGGKLQGGVLGAGLLAGGTAMQLSSTDATSQILGALSTVSGAAVTGGVIGSVIPGVGTAIGAGVGAGIGAAIAGVNFLLSQNAEESRKAAAAQQEYADSLKQSASALASIQGAQKSVNDSLLESGGAVGAAGVQQSIQGQIEALPESIKSHFGEAQAAQFSAVLRSMNLSNKELAEQISGSKPVFDALVTNFRSLGGDGAFVADQFIKLRDQILQMADVGQRAGPVMQQLAAVLQTDVGGAAAQVRTAFQSIPQDIPLNVDMPNVPAAVELLKKMGAQVDIVNGQPVILNTEDQKVKDAIAALDELGVHIKTLPTGQIQVELDQASLNAAKLDMNNFFVQFAKLAVHPEIGAINTNVPPPIPGGIPPPPGTPSPFPWDTGGKADGGVFPGYAPGIDSILAWVSPGEGVLIPEAVRGLGGSAGVYALNSMFRTGLSRRGYDSGGVVPGGPGAAPGMSPIASDVAAGLASVMAPVIGLLTEIRDGLRGSSIAGGLGGGGTAIFAGGGSPNIAPIGGTGLQAAISLAQRANGGQYQLGATGGANNTIYDCSGFMSDIYAALTGKPYSGTERYFTTTSDFPSLGFQPGYDPNSAFNIGVSPSHMAGTLAGVNVESGANGVQFGGKAAGALDPQFLQQYHLPMAISGLPALAGAGSPKQLREAQERIDDLTKRVDLNKQKLDATLADPKKSAIQRQEAQDRYDRSVRELADAQTDAAAMMRGGGGAGGKGFDYSTLPYGDPNRVMAGILGGLGVTPDDIGAIIGSTGAPVGQVLSDIVTNVGSVQLPGPLGYPGTPTSPSTSINQLAAERNPLFFAQSAGFNVPDYTRQGGGPGASDLTINGGPPADATGRIYSDTAALIDRTLSGFDAAAKARHDQQMAVLNQIVQKLTKDVLAPVVRDGVSGGINGIGQGVTAAIGSSMGQAAAGPIAQAVASAVPSSSGQSTGGQIVNTAMNVGTAAVNGIGAAAKAFADGGVFPGYAPGVDSILSWVSPGEGVLIPEAVRALGGPAGIYAINSRFRAGLSRAGYADGGVVGGNDVSATVGADFFGVSQVPILGAIVNLLVAVLLKVIGVQIQARDTLTEISGNFREFRGEFKAFDASGRLMNDTSGMVDRSSSSEQQAADERIRILKLVLEGLVKFIIEQIIVPIAKAVAQSVIQIGAQLASGAIQGGLGAAFPGGSVVGGAVGGVVSSIITSAGNAAVDIIASVGTTLAESLISVGIDAFGELFQSAMPDVVNALFGGGLLAAIFDPITAVLGSVLGAVTMLFGGAFTALGSLFDDGGMANGVGLMPKATIAPERVLSPQQTVAFERLVDALTTGNIGGDNTSKSVSFGDLHFHGTHATPEGVRDTLLDLISE